MWWRRCSTSPTRRPRSSAPTTGITVGALQELCRRGDDAALLGFDDFELSHLMPRPLTLIAYDPRELGRLAADRLFAPDRSGDKSWPTTTIVPTQLIERGLR